MTSKHLYGCVWILVKGINSSWSHCHRTLGPVRLDYFIVSGFFSYLLTADSTLANSFLGNLGLITCKISWIVGWLWFNHVYTCISIHISVIDFINWYVGCKSKYSLNLCWCFVSGNLHFGLEKSWKSHGTFFWDFCGNLPRQFQEH